MNNLNNLTWNPNKSNRGSAIGPPRVDDAAALSCGFYDLITFQNTADHSTTLLF